VLHSAGGSNSVHGGASNPHLIQHSHHYHLHHQDHSAAAATSLHHAYTASGPLTQRCEGLNARPRPACAQHVHSSTCASPARQEPQPIRSVTSTATTAGTVTHTAPSKDLCSSESGNVSKDGAGHTHQSPAHLAMRTCNPTGLQAAPGAHSSHIPPQTATITSPFEAASHQQPDVAPEQTPPERSMQHGCSVNNSDKHRSRRGSLLSLLSGALGVTIGGGGHKEEGNHAMPPDEQQQQQWGVDQPRRSPQHTLPVVQGMQHKQQGASRTALDSLFTAGGNATSHGPTDSKEVSGGLQAPSPSSGVEIVSGEHVAGAVEVLMCLLQEAFSCCFWTPRDRSQAEEHDAIPLLHVACSTLNVDCCVVVCW
jgi:hypothetical protein